MFFPFLAGMSHNCFVEYSAALSVCVAKHAISCCVFALCVVLFVCVCACLRLAALLACLLLALSTLARPCMTLVHFDSSVSLHVNLLNTAF